MQTRDTFRNVVRALKVAAVTSAIGIGVGCGGDAEDGDGDSETGGFEDCDACGAGDIVYHVECLDVSDGFVGLCRACDDSVSGANSQCDTSCAGYTGYDHHEDAEVAPCSENANEGTCSTWDPASEVTWRVKGAHYELEYSFIEDLIATPAPLWTCDNTTVHPHATSGFIVANADADELLYELGLRDDDRPVDLNGYELDTWAEVGIAFGELWINDSETDYTLTLTRQTKSGPQTVEVDYKLVNPPT